MYINKKEKFNYKSTYIESVYVFKDGDFILFGVPEKSILFDGKTLNQKMNLCVSSDSCFFDLDNDEFAFCINFTHFQINKFNSDKTSFQNIQKISTEEGSARQIIRISNGDICISKNYVGYINYSFYRKNSANPNYAPYGINYFKFIENWNDLININDKEILTYKFNVASDSLVLNVIDNKEYKEVRKNEIKFRSKEIGERLFINATSKLKLVKDNKIVAFSTFYLYIFGLDYLELETTIKFDYNIKSILVRPKGNIFLFLEKRDAKMYQHNSNIGRNTNYYYVQYINSLKIDFKTNDLLEKKEEEISDIMGYNKDIFKMYNYIGNGLVTLIDETTAIIYEDCDD